MYFQFSVHVCLRGCDVPILSQICFVDDAASEVSHIAQIMHAGVFARW